MKPYFTLTAPHATDNGWPPGAVGVEVGYVLTRSDLEASVRGEPPRHAARELPRAEGFELHCVERVAARTDPAIAEYVGADWLTYLLDACTDRSREGIESIAQRVTTRALGDEGDENATRILADAILGVCRGAANAAASSPETFIAEVRKRADEVHAGEGLSAYVTAQHFTPTVLHAVGLDEGYQWHRPVLRFDWLYHLACAVWEGGAAADWRRYINHRPALTVALACDVVRDVTMNPQVEIPLGNGAGTIKDRQGNVVATYDPDARDLINKHLGAFRTVTGHRLLRGIVHGVHDQAAEGHPNWLRLTYEGGFQGMKEALGCTSGQDREKLKALLQVGQALHFKTKHLGEVGGLWTWRARPARRGRPGAVTITVGDILAPGAQGLIRGKTGRSKSMAKRLVPELRKEPPTNGARPRDAGQVWSLHRLLLLELVTKRRELYLHGGVHISQRRWRQLSAEAGLSLAFIERVLDSWTEGESEQSPKLIERDGDRFTLASPHATELAFIREGARRMVTGQRRWHGKGKGSKG